MNTTMNINNTTLTPNTKMTKKMKNTVTTQIKI